jgi:hypothetical protein
VKCEDLDALEPKTRIIANRSNDYKISQKFTEEIQKEFEMSMLGELSFFLGL